MGAGTGGDPDGAECRSGWNWAGKEKRLPQEESVAASPWECTARRFGAIRRSVADRQRWTTTAPWIQSNSASAVEAKGIASPAAGDERRHIVANDMPEVRDRLGECVCKDV